MAKHVKPGGRLIIAFYSQDKDDNLMAFKELESLGTHFDDLLENPADTNLMAWIDKTVQLLYQAKKRTKFESCPPPLPSWTITEVDRVPRPVDFYFNHPLDMRSQSYVPTPSIGIGQKSKRPGSITTTNSVALALLSFLCKMDFS